MATRSSTRALLPLAKSFLIIGSVSFGGYLALVAMIRERLVVQGKLTDEKKITEAIALGSLLPGPLAVNVVAYVSYRIAGPVGALVSVFCVLIPSYLLVLMLTVLYFRFQASFNFNFILMGVTPVVASIIFSMGIAMARKNAVGRIERIVALVSLTALFMFPGYWTIVGVLLMAGFTGTVVFRNTDISEKKDSEMFKGWSFVWLLAAAVSGTVMLSLFLQQNLNVKLFVEFAKSSLTLFGGGYVMVPVLQTLLVEHLKWVTESEFLMGISLGQITPGPILISTVFFGYKVNGIMGSLAAAVGIFLPSSLLMIVCSRFYSHVSENAFVVAAVRGIKPAIVGLIIYSGCTIVLDSNVFSTVYYPVFFTIISFFMVEYFKINTAKAVLIGGGTGFLVYLLFYS